jgi:hypothetical protein
VANAEPGIPGKNWRIIKPATVAANGRCPRSVFEEEARIETTKEFCEHLHPLKYDGSVGIPEDQASD